MKDNSALQSSSSTLPSRLDSMLSGKPMGLLFMDGAIEQYRDVLTNYLLSRGAVISRTGFVVTDEYALDHLGLFSLRRLDWPVADIESGYFAGTFPNSRGTDTVVGLQFSGDKIMPEDTLLVAARLYDRGTYFNALLHVLERHFGRNFEDASNLSNLAFFGEVRDPADYTAASIEDYFLRPPGKATARNVLVSLGTDKNRPRRWFGYVPIKDGEIVGTPAVYMPINSQQSQQQSF
ncbi:hypothetical protein HYU18_01965 [Candidatus Woesearchaeota archaeon]|nr:hypothetical protein [Candidatus Woesearchaeota archaeon]